MAFGKNNKINYTLGDKIFYFIVYFILAVALIIVLYPLLYVLSSSFSSSSAVVGGKVWLWPVKRLSPARLINGKEVNYMIGIDFQGYRAVFADDDIWQAYLNTIEYTVIGTIVNLIVTTLAAYPLSRKDFAARDTIMFVFSFTMFFGGGLIPWYLVIKQLGLLNTRAAMIIPAAMSVYNMIIMRTFFQSNIPDELLESARLDGCTDFRFVWSIVLPLSKAVMAVMVLYYAVGHWNQYFNALILLSDKTKYPLQMKLREILIINSVDATTMLSQGTNLEEQLAKIGLKDLLKYAIIVVAAGPVLCIYPFIQKYFVQGVMIGAIKG